MYSSVVMHLQQHQVLLEWRHDCEKFRSWYDRVSYMAMTSYTRDS